MLTDPEEIIKSIICSYSSAYPTRYSVLKHLFFINGNGSYWTKTGHIKADAPLCYTPTDGSIDSLKQTLSFFEKNDDIAKIINLKIRYREQLLEFTKNNIDLISSTYFYYEDSHKPSYLNLSDYYPNSILRNIPKNVHLSWKIIIIEFLNLVINDISEKYCIPSHLSENSSVARICKELRNILDKI